MTSSATVARRFLEAFAEAGVPRVFGIPGVHNLPFWRDQIPGQPPIIGVRHEQTTVYAADGLARATGLPTAALTTTGPGAANAAGAFGEAAACGSPVVLVASEVASRFTRGNLVKGVLHQSRDQAGIFEPLAKAVYRPRTATAAVEAIGEAFHRAMEWPRGPVYVDVPTDVLSQPAPPAGYTPPDRCAVDHHALGQLASLVRASEKVVIWCGAGVVQAEAEPQVVALAECLQAPVVTTFGARGVVPPGHPCHVALPPHEPETVELIAGADLLLVIGSDLDGMMTRNWTMTMPRLVAVINASTVDLVKNCDPAVAVLGDARDALEALLPQVGKPRAATAHGDAIAAGLERLRASEDDRPGFEFVERVDAAVGPDTQVVCDMAVGGYWFGGYGQIHRTRQLQYPVGWGTLGYALPAAIGPASIGMPTLAICGDGGVMFGLSEDGTIAQESLPVTLLVLDDGGYGMLAYDQEIAGDERSGVDLRSPDWALLGASFGIDTVVQRGVGTDLESALRVGLESGKPSIVVAHTAMTPPRTTSARWSN